MLVTQKFAEHVEGRLARRGIILDITEKAFESGHVHQLVGLFINLGTQKLEILRRTHGAATFLLNLLSEQKE